MGLLALFRLSRREYFADFFITPPITLALLVWSLVHFTWEWPLDFAAGVMLWTFYEYVAHRCLFHCTWLARDFHALHHDNQRDYIAFHPALTVTAYAAMWAIFGVNSSALMVGFSVGYVLYSAAHTAFHYSVIKPGHWLYGLKRHHALHHTFHEVNYGVTTTLWDRVFNTRRA